LKAFQELARLSMDLDEEDACEILATLRPSDLARRVVSTRTGEWMYVFTPTIGGTVVYIKVVVRNDCVVISFHEDENNDEDE
jgi:hypothetical protein